ncbi:MAG: hypothetical protein ABIR10_02160 [Dokdonella sp.]
MIAPGFMEMAHPLRPLDAGFGGDEAAPRIEIEDATHAVHVDLHSACNELLAVPA